MNLSASQIFEGNILLSEYLELQFTPYKGNHLLGINFKTYAECKNYIKENNWHEYVPELGLGKGVGNYDNDFGQLMKAVDKIIKHKYADGDNSYFVTFGMYDAQDNTIMVRLNRHQLFSAETLIEATWLAVVDWIKNNK
jgi:hypothetical protein